VRGVIREDIMDGARGIATNATPSAYPWCVPWCAHRRVFFACREVGTRRGGGGVVVAFLFRCLV
jgi:hypothetical protein